MQIPDAVLRPIVEGLGHDWPSFCAQRLFCPHHTARVIELHQSGVRLVHYTKTETAIKIAEGRAVWLRNVRCMNDFSEVQWGARLLERFFDSDEADPFWTALESIQPGIRGETATLYRGWAQDFVRNTYVFCVSEHDIDVDPLGRLSMWRAYAQSNGCALVLKARPFYQVSDALGSYSYPVCYKSDEAANDMFRSIVGNISANADFLRSFSREDLVGQVFSMMEYHAICMKHPAFEEEREWRVVHRPLQNPNARMKSEIISLNGVVQKIYKLPMENVPEENLIGIEPSEVVEELMLGPSADGAVARDAVIEKLTSLNFANPEVIVRETHIPLRT